MLDNNNKKLLTAYKIDTATKNILGKTGTPTKMKVPEPQMDPKVDYRKQKLDSVEIGKMFVEKRLLTPNFNNPRSLRKQHQLITKQ